MRQDVFVQYPALNPTCGKCQMVSPGGRKWQFVLTGVALALAIAGASAQESGMPTQSGGQEPEMPGTTAPASPNSENPDDGSPQTLRAEEKGVKLNIVCADNQPVKECANIAAKLLEQLQSK